MIHRSWSSRTDGGAGLSQLVGRGGELAALVAALDSLGPARASWVQVTGEPGIGKTRLIGELCETAESRGALVLGGGAAELERDVPFGVVIDAFDDYLGSRSEARLVELCGRQLGQLHRIFPALSHLGPPDASRAEDERYPAYRALRLLVERLAVPGPLVVVLDDLQWADIASIELVSFLLRRPPKAAVLVVLAWRPGQTPALAARLSSSARDAPGTALGLTGLSEDEVRTIKLTPAWWARSPRSAIWVPWWEASPWGPCQRDWVGGGRSWRRRRGRSWSSRSGPIPRTSPCWPWADSSCRSWFRGRGG